MFFFQIAIIPKTEDLEIFGTPGNQSVAVLALQTAFEDNDCEKMFISANPMYYNLTEECEGMAILVMEFQVHGSKIRTILAKKINIPIRND